MPDDDAGRRRRPGATADDSAAARRAFIRSSHPDVGGDPEAFIVGLARFDAGRAPTTPAVLVRRSRRPDRILKHTLRTLRRRLSGVPPRRLK